MCFKEGSIVGRRENEGLWDAGSLRAPLFAVRPELRVAAHCRGLQTQVPRAAHPVRERAAAVQGLVR